jgi:hypothetical protein
MRLRIARIIGVLVFLLVIGVVGFYSLGFVELEQQRNSPEAKCQQAESSKMLQARHRCEVDVRQEHPWATWSWVDNRKQNDTQAAVCYDIGTHEVYFQVEEKDCHGGNQ